jgi:hypothetical protein
MFTKMDKRFKYGLALGLVLALILATVALGAVETDQEDYAPGSIVTISGYPSEGAEYIPGATVNVNVNGPNGWSSPCSATVDGNGEWFCTVTLDPDPAVAVGDYMYTATSVDANGNTISETGTFTDGNATSVSGTVKDTSNQPISGATVSCTSGCDGSFSTTTDADGQYFFDSAPGHGSKLAFPGSGSANLTLTASKSGYTSEDQSFNVNHQGIVTGVDFTLTPSVSNQTITVTSNAPANTVYNTSFTVAATASSGLPVAITSSGVCSGSGSGSATITMTSGTGTCTVHYNQAGNASYTAAPEVTEEVTAEKANQTITVDTSAPASAVYNTDFTVAASASSVLPVAYSGSGVCTNVGATFTMTSGTGTCTVKYNQAGDDNYNAAPEVTEEVTAEKANQTITFGALADKIIGDPDFNVSASASSGLPVSFSASGSCSIIGTLVHITGVGSCSITASQSGNDNYNAAPDAIQTFSISYNFEGFFRPVDNGVLNIAKAGQAIPLKWRLTDAYGVPVLDLTTWKITVETYNCALGTTTDALEQYATGSSGLQNLGDGYYQINWKTPTAFANSCKTMKLDIGEGIFRTALFQFKK